MSIFIQPYSKGAPDGVWHHRNRRLMYQHLTKHPKSDGTAAGSRDISFLYDVSADAKKPLQAPGRFDKSGTRLQALQEVSLEKILSVHTHYEFAMQGKVGRSTIDSRKSINNYGWHNDSSNSEFAKTWKLN